MLDIVGLNLEINNMSYVIIGIYNHHANSYESFKNTLTKLHIKYGKEKRMIIASDLNVNLLQHGEVNDITEWVDSVIKNFTFIIETPTRITNHSKTLIDNYLINDLLSNS